MWKDNKMDAAKVQELFGLNDLKQQFEAFFPGLKEENWEEVLNARHYPLKGMPYQLKLENTSGYMEDCHFCNNRSCRVNCPCPYSSKMTVLDLLHKIGVEDNVSFYDNRGKRDVILSIVWHSDFEDTFIKQLSGMTTAKKLDSAPQDSEIEETQQITLRDCFEEFRKPEMLDDENKWYCNKCKDHVRATKQMEMYKPPPILIVNLKRFKQSG